MKPLTEWVKKPFTEDMDLLSVVLTTVLVVTVAFLWTRILGQISEQL